MGATAAAGPTRQDAQDALHADLAAAVVHLGVSCQQVPGGFLVAPADAGGARRQEELPRQGIARRAGGLVGKHEQDAAVRQAQPAPGEGGWEP